jgi:hypothetical protein
MTDYSKFKTPFVEISIGNAKGKNMQPLPTQIAKLVEKVEIMETLCCNSFNQITIVFNEGSREPYSTQGFTLDTSVYPSEGIFGLDNRSGSLVDLRATSGSITETVADITSFLDLPEGELLTGGISELLGKDNTPPEPIIEEEQKPSPKDNINYLLEQRNQVKVTWGYKESPESIRSVIAYIMVVTSEFPEKGTPKTTIVCHDSAAIADQLVTNSGKNFGIEVEAGTDENGNSIKDIKDLSPKEIIEKLCENQNVDCIVSDTFKTPEHEFGKNTQWVAGESLHQFFNRLARRYNAVYRFQVDPNNCKDTIIFITEEEWQKHPLYSGDQLFVYKGNGSILKSLNIKADFGGSVGTFLKSVNEEGAKSESKTITPDEPVALFESVAPTDPTVGNNKPNVAEFAEANSNGGVSGNLGISAESNPASLKGKGQSLTGSQGSKVVAMDFTTLGYPQLSPGNIKFGGIGARYSGFYNVQSVRHVIDSQGYNCRGVATSFKVSEGGVEPFEKVSENIKSDPVEVQVFENEKAPEGSAKDKYNKTFIENSNSKKSEPPPLPAFNFFSSGGG